MVYFVLTKRQRMRIKHSVGRAKWYALNITTEIGWIERWPQHTERSFNRAYFVFGVILSAQSVGYDIDKYSISN